MKTSLTLTAIATIVTISTSAIADTSMISAEIYKPYDCKSLTLFRSDFENGTAVIISDHNSHGPAATANAHLSAIIQAGKTTGCWIS